MKLKTAFAIMALCLALVAPSPAGTSALDVLIAKARTQETQGRSDLAAQTWQQILLADPNQQDALAAMAAYSKRNGRVDEANKYLARLRKVNPAAAGNVDTQSLARDQQNQLQQAAHLASQQHYDEAMKIYRSVFPNEPSSDWALAYYETEAATSSGWNHAIAGLKNLIDKHPGNETYRLALGKIYTYHVDTRQAGVQLLESIPAGSNLAPQARDAWHQALVWSIPNPRFAPSLKSYLARYPDAELQSRWAAAKPPATAAAPHEDQASLLRGREEKLGYDALKADRLTDAEAAFQRALAEVPESPGALSGLGFVRMKLQDFSGAEQFLEKANSLSPADRTVKAALDTARFWNDMQAGTAALNDNHADQAVELFHNALTLRPTNQDAARALAGAYLQQGNAAAARPIYAKLAKIQPGDSEIWRGLVKATRATAEPSETIALVRTIPAAAQTSLKKDLDFVLMLASVEADAGNPDDSHRLFEEALELARTRQSDLTVGVQLQFAGLFQRMGRPDQAAPLFQRLVDNHPSNVEAWKGLLNSLSEIKGDEMRAYSALNRVPKDIFTAAVREPAFLRTAALVYSRMKYDDIAETYLKRAASIESSNGGEPSLATQLQLASVWSEHSQPEKAQVLLRKLADAHPDSADVWKARLGNLHAQQRDEEALAEIERIPIDLMSTLAADPIFVSLQAGIYAKCGRGTEAKRLIRETIARMQIDQKVIPADLKIQLAWVLLDQQNGGAELVGVLGNLQKSRSLSGAQQQEISQIWSAFIRRRAEAARIAGDLDKTASILRAGARLLPTDSQIRASLAGALVQTGKFSEALAVYKAWGLNGATASDYMAAIDAAGEAHDKAQSNEWLSNGLKRYPRDADLLKVAARRSASEGDYKKAEAYLRSARTALVKQERQAVPKLGDLDPDATSASASQSSDSTRALARLLLDDDDGVNDSNTQEAKTRESTTQRSARPLPPSSLRDSAGDPDEPANSKLRIYHEPSTSLSLAPEDFAPKAILVADWNESVAQPDSRPKARVRRPAPKPAAETDRSGASTNGDTDFLNELLRSSEPKNTSVRPRNDDSFIPRTPATAESSYLMPADPTPEAIIETTSSSPKLAVTQQPARTQTEEIDDQISAIESRNTPYFGASSSISARSGQVGYDHMVTEESAFEASTTLNNAVRVSLFARPVMLDSGKATDANPDITSTMRFGLLPAGATPPSQSQTGIGADLQLSMQDFGLKIGSSPLEFLVHNWTGGVRYQPFNGPITLLVSRDSVTDTILSYAGSHDPVTNQIWGGVVANSFRVNGSWGDANSGFYLNAGYQDITGKNVATNTRIDASGGTYWRILTRPGGSLTVGLNVSAMHYEKDLRYFSFGQGGYFSPQQYYLFNLPVRWTGTYRKKLQYSISGSFGAQHFEEDASPYYPTLPGLQGVNGPYYSAQSDTGPNFSIDARAIYQFSPSWLFGVYANANNARDYTSESLGFFLKYLIHPRPITEDFFVPSLPDWKGSQPFSLP